MRPAPGCFSLKPARSPRAFWDTVPNREASATRTPRTAPAISGSSSDSNHCAQRRGRERIAVQHQPGRRFSFRAARGVQKSARRSQRPGFRARNARCDIFHRRRIEMPGDDFRPVAGGQNHAPDLLRGQIADDPFQKRPAVHRRHRLGNIRQQMPDAPAETAGQDDGGQVFGRHLHKRFIRG